MRGRALALRRRRTSNSDGKFMRAVVGKDCLFLVACFGFQPSTRTPCSSAEYRDNAYIASFANTEINARLFCHLVLRKQVISSAVVQRLGE